MVETKLVLGLKIIDFEKPDLMVVGYKLTITDTAKEKRRLLIEKYECSARQRQIVLTPDANTIWLLALRLKKTP
jgi:hypothetical protein